MEDDEESGGLISKLAQVVERVLGHVELAMLVGTVSIFLSTAQIFGEISEELGTAIVIVTIAFWALKLFSSNFSSLSIRISILGAEIALKTLKVAGRAAAAREVAISISYLESAKQQTLRAKIGLLICSFTLLLASFMSPQLELLDASAISAGMLGLLFLKDALLEYRIRSGFFGSNRAEAKDLIEFLVRNSEDIDFTDGGGKLRKALEPEVQRLPMDGARPVQDGAVA